MSFLDDLPHRETAHDTGEAALTAFRCVIDGVGLFLIQGEDPSDYGTDIQIDARDGKAITNIRVHVQVKGTNRADNSNGSVSISVARTNLNYLLLQPDSFFVCYHLPSNRLLVCVFRAKPATDSE